MFIQINNIIFNSRYLVGVGSIYPGLYHNSEYRFKIELTTGERAIFGTQTDLEAIRTKLLSKISPTIIKP